MEEMKKIVEKIVKHFENKNNYFQLFYENRSSAEGWVTWEIIKVLKEKCHIKEFQTNKKDKQYGGKKPDIFYESDSKKIILEIKARYFEPEKYKEWIFDTKRALAKDLEKINSIENTYENSYLFALFWCKDFNKEVLPEKQEPLLKGHFLCGGCKVFWFLFKKIPRVKKRND